MFCSGAPQYYGGPPPAYFAYPGPRRSSGSNYKKKARKTAKKWKKAWKGRSAGKKQSKSTIKLLSKCSKLRSKVQQWYWVKGSKLGSYIRHPKSGYLQLICFPAGDKAKEFSYVYLRTALKDRAYANRKIQDARAKFGNDRVVATFNSPAAEEKYARENLEAARAAAGATPAAAGMDA